MFLLLLLLNARELAVLSHGSLCDLGHTHSCLRSFLLFLHVYYLSREGGDGSLNVKELGLHLALFVLQSLGFHGKRHAKDQVRDVLPLSAELFQRLDSLLFSH